MDSIHIDWVGNSRQAGSLLRQVKYSSPEITISFTDSLLPYTRTDLYLIDHECYADFQAQIERITAPPAVIFGNTSAVFSFAACTSCADAVLMPPDYREFVFRVYRNALNKTIDFGTHHIRYQETSITGSAGTLAATYHEYLLLRMFANNPGRVFSKETIAAYLDIKSGKHSRNVDMHISQLRNKLLAAMGMTDDSGFDPLENVRTKGYRTSRKLVDNL